MSVEEIRVILGFICFLGLCKGLSQLSTWWDLELPGRWPCGVILIRLTEVRRCIYFECHCSLGKGPGQYKREKESMLLCLWTVDSMWPTPSHSSCSDHDGQKPGILSKGNFSFQMIVPSHFLMATEEKLIRCGHWILRFCWEYRATLNCDCVVHGELVSNTCVSTCRPITSLQKRKQM